MSIEIALALIVLAAIAGFVVAQLRASARGAGRERRIVELENEIKTTQASQAQVMHTTKLASLGQMVAGVAHEINTPVGFVKSNSEVIGDLLTEYEQDMTRLFTGVDILLGADAGTLERARELVAKAKADLAANTAFADAKDLLADSLDGIRTITELVANLKGFARVDSDGLDLVDLNESVRSALTIAAHQMRDRVKVVQQLEPLPKVRCMPSQINQVFLNLITNAAQAIPGDGTLTIASRAANDSVEVSFADTGTGIPDNVLPKIFDPFFTTKSVGEGTGLGLSIVHKIVKAHGGTIHVRTAMGQGTTFTVSLPTELKAVQAA